MRSTPLFTLATIGGFAALIMSGALMTSPAVQAIDDEHSNSGTARSILDCGLRPFLSSTITAIESSWAWAATSST